MSSDAESARAVHMACARGSFACVVAIPFEELNHSASSLPSAATARPKVLVHLTCVRSIPLQATSAAPREAVVILKNTFVAEAVNSAPVSSTRTAARPAEFVTAAAEPKMAVT